MVFHPGFRAPPAQPLVIIVYVRAKTMRRKTDARLPIEAVKFDAMAGSDETWRRASIRREMNR